MTNIENYIKNHNAKIIENSQNRKKSKLCNCIDKTECPMKGVKYRQNNVIYQKKKTKNEVKIYI